MLIQRERGSLCWDLKLSDPMSANQAPGYLLLNIWDPPGLPPPLALTAAKLILDGLGWGPLMNTK